MTFIKSIIKLKKDRYEDLKARNPYVFDWKWYSYRRFKLKLYVEVSSVLAYFLIKLRVKPNQITAVYALIGITGGILLAFPYRLSIFIAVLFFYFRGILDWTDGVVARASNQTSLNGMVFDAYGAHVGWIFLWTGLGFYLAHYTHPVFFYLSPVIPVLLAADLYSNARDTFIYHGILQKSGQIDKVLAKNPWPHTHTKLRKFKNIIDKMFEHNTRTVDLIVLMIVLENITPYKILWIFYLCFMEWQITIFTVRFLTIAHGGWAENELDKLKKHLYGKKGLEDE